MPKQTFLNLSQEKRLAILDIAIEEFAMNDYDSASISRIVANAGIAKGSFYQYFEDKKDLYLYLVHLATQEKIKFLSTMPPPEMEKGLFPYLRWLFSIGVSFQFSHPRLNLLAYRAVYGNNSIKEEVLENARQASLDYYKSLLDTGMKLGDVDSSIDKDLAAFLLTAVTNQLGNYLLERLDIPPETLLEKGGAAFNKSEIQEIFNQLLSIIEHGIGNKQDDQRGKND